MAAAAVATGAVGQMATDTGTTATATARAATGGNSAPASTEEGWLLLL